MSISPSTVVNLPLPRWAYVPGESADAAPDHDTLWQGKALVAPQIPGFVPAPKPALNHTSSINNAGGLWEPHQGPETGWAVAPLGGRQRNQVHVSTHLAN